jgi:hypothetical protein
MRKLLFNYSLYSHPEIGNFRVWQVGRSWRHGGGLLIAAVGEGRVNGADAKGDAWQHRVGAPPCRGGIPVHRRHQSRKGGGWRPRSHPTSAWVPAGRGGAGTR